MASLRAKLVNRYIRKTIKSLPLYEMEADEVRRIFKSKIFPWLPKGVRREVVETPVRGEWHIPQGIETESIILYFHGGGYVFGSPASHRALTYALAKRARAKVFSLDYRLAPEHPCPAAIEDALSAYQWLLEQGYRSTKISLAGDSAGGGLALATLQAIKANDLAMPASAVLYSPYIDLAIEGESATRNAESDAMFQLQSIHIGAKYYADRLNVKDPRVSPLYGELAGLSPLRVFASDTEILLDDSVRLKQRVKAVGGTIEFTSHNNLVHIWPVLYPLMPEAGQTISDSADFIRKHISAKQGNLSDAFSSQPTPA